MRYLLAVAAAAVVIGCGSSSSPGGGGGTGAGGTSTDAGSMDAGGGSTDAGSGRSVDAGAGSSSPDAGNPGAGSGGSDGGSGGPGPDDGSGSDGGASGSGSDAGTGSGGGTSDGGTTVLVPEQLTSGEKATVLALGDEHVYWATYENAGGWRNWHYRISAMPKSGSIPIRISEGAGAMITWLVARDGFVNWSMATCPVSCDTADYRTHIYRQGLSGPSWQYDVDTNLGQIAVDASRLYYRARRSPGPGGLWSIRLEGLDNKQLTTHDAGTGPVLDSGTLYYFDTGGDPDIGFWSALRTIPASGGAIQDVRTELNTLIWPGFLAVGAGSAFTNTQYGFWQAPLDGSKWQMTWGGSNIGGPDVNGKVYFPQSPYSSFDGCIVRANPNGSDATCIDKGKHSYGQVKVDDANVYFLRDGDVWRLPRQ